MEASAQTTNGVCVGVLALQGDFALHEAALRRVGVTPVLVKKAEDLSLVEALVIPGGESTAMLKLMDRELEDELVSRTVQGLPVYGTCAGLILLSNEVKNPEQRSLACLDVTVARNGYGRQIDSFRTDEIAVTPDGKETLGISTSKIQGVFIRAPRIVRVGPGVSILATLGGEPVAVMEGKVIATTFHPELLAEPSAFHRTLIRR